MRFFDWKVGWFRTELLAVPALCCLLAGYHAWARMPSCEDRNALNLLSLRVREDRKLGGLVLGSVETLDGVLFEPRRCSVLVTELRGSADLTSHPRLKLVYSVPLRSDVYEFAGTAMPKTSDPR